MWEWYRFRNLRKMWTSQKSEWILVNWGSRLIPLHRQIIILIELEDELAYITGKMREAGVKTYYPNTAEERDKLLEKFLSDDL